MAHEHESTGGVMEPPRRSFLCKAFTIFVGAGLPVAPIVAALGSLINPLRPSVRLKQAPSGAIPLGKDEGYFKTLSQADLQSAGTDPIHFSIIADRKDAWNIYPKAEIGAIYVQKLNQRRLDFERGWVPQTRLQEAVKEAGDKDKADVLTDLLEVEFALLKRQKEQQGETWQETDTAGVIATYSKLFPQDVEIVEKTAKRPKWEGALRVYNHSCPHAGCAVDYKRDAEGKAGYYCPCHDSRFSIGGERGESSPSPRDLDRLRYGYDEAGTLCVKFQNFKAGHEAQESV